MITNDLEEQKRLKELNNKKRSKFLKLYIVPIFTIIIFVGIIVVLVAPKINDVFAKLDEVSANNNTITDLNQQLTQLKTLNSNLDTITSNLTTVNSIASAQNTEVIKFRDKISDLTTQNNLVIVAQKLSESTLTPDASNPGLTGNINLIEVPFIFEIAGRFADIKSFISSLNTIDDFVIVKEMELGLKAHEGLSNTEIQVTDEWSLKIDLVKYQFISGKDLQAIYLAVPATAAISSQMRTYIQLRQAKAAALVQETNPQTELDTVNTSGDLTNP